MVVDASSSDAAGNAANAAGLPNQLAKAKPKPKAKPDSNGERTTHNPKPLKVWAAAFVGCHDA